MDPLEPVEYSFGTGHGEPTSWSSVPDLIVGGGSVPNAVRLDFDGDGLLDDAMWDSDGDGIADHSILDVDLEESGWDELGLDAAGEQARYFTDPSGAGTWNLEVQGPERAAPESTEQRLDEQRSDEPAPGVPVPAPAAAHEPRLPETRTVGITGMAEPASVPTTADVHLARGREFGVDEPEDRGPVTVGS